MPERWTGELLDEAERALYLAVLADGGRLRMTDVAPADALALTRLLGLGLVVPRVEDGAYVTVNPRAAIGRMGAELRAAGTAALAEADEVAERFGDLTRAYDAAPRRVEHTGEIRHVRAFDRIRHRLAQLDAECSQEVLIAQPGGARPTAGLAEALRRLRLLTERGVTIRCLYEPGAVTHPETAGFAAAATELGCRYRVLAEPFKRVLIYDRRVAVIPAAPDNSSAAFVEDPAVVDFLVDSYERDWQLAERVKWTRCAEAPPIDPPAHEQVGRLLAQGLTQRSVASRMGLSERTVAAHISRLRELHDAETLFQLGWQLRAVAEMAGRDTADRGEGEGERL
ncbi:LuxR C-terminal-related transcriptional regulator [Kitasatospora sp. NPDC004240]